MSLIKEKEALINELIAMGIKDEKILKAIETIPRELFVLPHYIGESYKNYPLPILNGQTISQPYTVAFMLQLLEIKKSNKILEIGSGSGYNAAIMSLLAKKIISIEIIKELAEFAKNNLKKASITNVEIINSDGCYGYEKESPYDRIIITAATPKIPLKLISQLKEEGIIVFPLDKGFYQVMTKIKNNKIEYFGYFSFVPLKGNIKSLNIK